MANILYVHGFGSNHNAGTFLQLKEVFPNHKFISADFDLLDVQGTLSKISKLCKEHDIHLIIGKSLGGFYTMAYEGPQDKMLINPCVKPWIEIPKLDSSVPAEILEEWKNLFEKTEKNIHAAQRTKSFGIFGDNDKLFSYKDYFDQKYGEINVGLKKSYMIPGEHHIGIENLKIAVQKGLDYFGMMEEYSYVFPLMPYFQLIKEPDEDYELNFSQAEKQRIISKVENYHNKINEYKNNKIFNQ